MNRGLTSIGEQEAHWVNEYGKQALLMIRQGHWTRTKKAEKQAMILKALAPWNWITQAHIFTDTPIEFSKLGGHLVSAAMLDQMITALIRTMQSAEHRVLFTKAESEEGLATLHNLQMGLRSQLALLMNEMEDRIKRRNETEQRHKNRIAELEAEAIALRAQRDQDVAEKVRLQDEISRMQSALISATQGLQNMTFYSTQDRGSAPVQATVVIDPVPTAHPAPQGIKLEQVWSLLADYTMTLRTAFRQHTAKQAALHQQDVDRLPLSNEGLLRLCIRKLKAEIQQYKNHIDEQLFGCFRKGATQKYPLLEKLSYQLTRIETYIHKQSVINTHEAI